jgi:hypothetical protein
MSDKDILIQQLDAARQALRTAIEGLDREAEIYSGWTLKQLLAHVAGWDDAVITSLQAHIKGNEPGAPADRGIDHYNAESVATREALPYERIHQEWELAREQLKCIIRDMPEDKFATPLLFPWGHHGTVSQIVAIFTGHEHEHAIDLEALKVKLASPPSDTVPEQKPSESETTPRGG